ncbi:MAG TPA: NAD-dependent epimerase/dehydratase family protein [Spirochaetota bacterium]|nr:NAD-dependent epimerase/dehydratase family protein [Spirochaetota bacterium]
MKALVTGATGFIGSVLVRELLFRGHRVHALALPGENTEGLERAGVTVLPGDLTDRESIGGVCAGADVVFHLAARVTDWGTRVQFYGAIFGATENLLREAAGTAGRFVYISSIAALGLGSHLKGVLETAALRKSGVPYNDAKADAEALVREYHDSEKIDCVIVRPANVTGPGSVWVTDIVERMRDMMVPLIDGGRHSASLVYVDSLVDGIIRAGTMDAAPGRAYHFRDDWEVSWERYVTDLGAMIGKRPRGNVPFRAAWAAGRLLEAALTPLNIRAPLTRLAAGVMGRDNDVDTTLARSELGWRSTVSYPKAMEKIGAWVRERYV